jgi:acylaminoacyl-peptidase
MQWMAARGYVVVFGNPRGSAGYGLKFRSAIQFDWGNLDYQDVSRIADWLFKQRYVDGRRVGVTGGSYGGYMTNWLVAHTHRFRAAVTQRSVVSFESFYGVSDMGYLPGWMAPKPPWDDAAPYRRQSPLTYVKKVRTPLLIIHSEEDWRCPVSQADELFTALKMLGVETELVRFEGESHGLSRGGRPQNRAERLRQIMRWMDKHLAKA